MADLKPVPPLHGPYDHLADEYDRLFVSRAARAEDFVVRRDLRRFARGAHVLDVACGTGYVFDQITGLAKSRSGVDISRTMVALAQAKHPTAEFFVEDMVYPAKRSRAFDLVTCLWALNYAGSKAAVERVVSAMLHDLQPGGRFYVVMYCRRRALRFGYPPIEGSPGFWSAATLREIFSPFKGVDVRGLSWLVDRVQWLPQPLCNAFAWLESHLLGRLFPDRFYFFVITGRK